eukprot:6852561-Pyramimonas_sp.AAC.3
MLRALVWTLRATVWTLTGSRRTMQGSAVTLDRSFPSMLSRRCHPHPPQLVVQGSAYAALVGLATDIWRPLRIGGRTEFASGDMASSKVLTVHSTVPVSGRRQYRAGPPSTRQYRAGSTELGSTELGSTELGYRAGPPNTRQYRAGSTELGSTELGSTELGSTEPKGRRREKEEEKEGWGGAHARVLLGEGPDPGHPHGALRGHRGAPRASLGSVVKLVQTAPPCLLGAGVFFNLREGGRVPRAREPGAEVSVRLREP